MPTVSEYRLPKTDNAYEFEDMVKDYCELKYEQVQRLGRRGQKQNGVDILATGVDKNGEQVNIGVQCKNVEKISTKDIDKIIEEVKKFPQPLDGLIIATAASRDIGIQLYIREKTWNGKRIEVLFWDEIATEIAGDEKLFKKYYPVFAMQLKNNISIENLKEVFNEGIYKCKISDFVRCDPREEMPRDLVSNVGIFCSVLEKNLKKHIILQNNSVYIAIKEFCNWMGDYNQYLGRHMSPAGTGYYAITEKGAMEEVKKKTDEWKKEIDRCYGEINPDCSLFS